MIPFFKGDSEPSVTLTGRGIQIHRKICLGKFWFSKFVHIRIF